MLCGWSVAFDAEQQLMSLFDKQAAEREQLAQLAILQARDRQDFAKVAGSEEGRRFLARLLAECGTGKVAFDKDPLVMAKNCGRHEVGFFVQGMFADFEGFYQLMREEARAYRHFNQGLKDDNSK